ncbi:M48 family metallopeptidase [Paraburkholderia sp. SUR17]|uniref:M48 family metallopeptidase n=1 Tax=Paraburkholderia sp. SUR17 TaxID=3034358 RepID=UPI002407A254|nr:M48 family metallopeptidase [Paraburkholderia sp. SUR17]WEY38851.1 M48 family metallopeptidase [Paraburkholderia sp. SUR17]
MKPRATVATDCGRGASSPASSRLSALLIVGALAATGLLPAARAADASAGGTGSTAGVGSTTGTSGTGTATGGTSAATSMPPATVPASNTAGHPPAATPASATAASASSTPGGTPFSPSGEVRYGPNMATFRNLIPSSMLDAQAAAEFQQIVYGAQHQNRLYPDTDARVKRVRAIVERLASYSSKWNDRVKGWKWDVAVIQSPAVRMYCLPGGKVVVYGGMLDRVRLNDDELGVLTAHEIAHALREHARERLGEQQAAQLGSGSIPQLFGLADLGAAPLGIGTQLLEMKYESADETEADVIGADIASRAGYDPRAAVTLWDKLAVATRADREQGFIYVHPYTTARRKDIMKRLTDMLPLYAKAVGSTVDALPDYAGTPRTPAEQRR